MSGFDNRSHFKWLREVNRFIELNPQLHITFPLSDEHRKMIEDFYTSRVTYFEARGWRRVGAEGRVIDQEGKNIPRFPNVSAQNHWMSLAQEYVLQHPGTTYPLLPDVIRQLDSQIEQAKK